MDEHPAVVLRLKCPTCYTKLWFDEKTGEWYCATCPFTVEEPDADDL